MDVKPIAAATISATRGQTIYPAPFDAIVAGRLKKKLGDIFGLSNFGVNLTELAPGAASALFHAHETQDEFIYILAGSATVRIGANEYPMNRGDCIGFKAATGLAHQLVNNGNAPVTYLEIGDRSKNDRVDYPEDDIRASLSADGSWIITHKDGEPYQV